MSYEEINAMSRDELVESLCKISTANKELLKNLDELREINRLQYEENKRLNETIDKLRGNKTNFECVNWSLEEIARGVNDTRKLVEEAASKGDAIYKLLETIREEHE